MNRLRHTTGPRTFKNLLRDQSAATTLEWTLLLAAIGLPSYYVIQTCLATLVEYYRMMSLINSLPFP